MTWPRSTPEELVARIRADIQTNLPGANAWLRRSVEDVVAKALVGVAHGMHGHLAWVARQLLPSEDADDETILLWADVHGLARKPSGFSKGTIEVTLFNQTIPATTELTRSDGRIYKTTTDLVSTALAEETLPVSVIADEAGSNGDAEIGTALTLSSPIANVQSVASVGDGGLIGGADRETIAELLARILLRLANPPSGGATGDYEGWALELPGATRAWERPLGMGPGTVTVYFVRDKQADIAPTQVQVAQMQAYLDTQKPVTATPFALAPSLVQLNPAIALDEDTPAARARVVAQLEELILRYGEPGGTLTLTSITSAIQKGGGDHALSSPAVDVTHAAAELPVLGSVAWS